MPALRKLRPIEWSDYWPRYSVVGLGVASAYHGLRVYGSPPGAFAETGLALALLAAPLGLALSAWLYAAKYQRWGTKIWLTLLALVFGASVLFMPAALVATTGWHAGLAAAGVTWLLGWGSGFLAERHRVFCSPGVLTAGFLVSLAVPIPFLSEPVRSAAPGWLVFLIGSAFGAAWLGHYFAVALALGCHSNEAGGAARIDHFCHFMRIKVEPHCLTCYVIGLEKLEVDAKDVKPKLIESFQVRTSD